MALSDWTMDNFDNLLIGEVATATLATVATQTPKMAKKDPSVARVATVAVARGSIRKKLTPTERAYLLNWLSHIGETNPDEIAYTIKQCETDVEAREWFLNRANKVSLFRIGGQQSGDVGSGSHDECAP